MRILVTGGAGFIGSAVSRALTARGHEVRVLDALLPAAHPHGRLPARLGTTDVRIGDVRDPADVGAALDGVDAVSHHAAMVGLGVGPDDLPGYASCNVLGTAVLLAAMARAGVGRLVLAGSMVVYGEGRYACEEHGTVAAPPRAESDLLAGRFEPRCPACGRELVPGLVPESAATDPRNTYAVTKLSQEQLARSWARETGGGVTTFRYHNVYGPGMPRDTPYAGVAAIFRSALERGEAPSVHEDGGQRRDFVHVEDVAAANVAALEPGAPTRDRTYNVGSGEPRTVLDMARALAAATGGPEPVVTGRYRLGDVRHITADSSSVRAELAWTPSRSLADGMAEFAAAPLRG